MFLEYELEIRLNGEWRKLDRVYGIHAVQNISFAAGDGAEVKMTNFSNNLIYRKNVPVQFGEPLHGWIVFAGSEDLHSAEIDRYRVTCIDAYRKHRRFETAPKEFENVFLLQDLAGIQIPPSAQHDPNL